MTVTGRLELVALDAPDIEKLAAFYAELTGWQIVRKDADWITMRTGDGQEVAFQLAPDHVAPQWPGQEHPQQFHLDLQIDDHEAAAERAVALGATRLADGADLDHPGRPGRPPVRPVPAGRRRPGDGPVRGDHRRPRTRRRWPASTPTCSAWRSPTTARRAR